MTIGDLATVVTNESTWNSMLTIVIFGLVMLAVVYLFVRVKTLEDDVDSLNYYVAKLLDEEHIDVPLDEE